MSNEHEETEVLSIERRIDKSTTGETGLTLGGSIAFSSMNQIMEFAKVMSIASVAIPKHLRGNAGACLAVAIQASEWQMSPFAVANKSYSVNDRLAYEAQLVNAVILRRAPIVGRFKIDYSGEGDARKCRVTAKLRDGDNVEYTSPPFGKIPVKNSPLWKSDPDQQLFYYSSRAMCRRHFPDVLLGIYTPDELDEPSMRTVTEVRAASIPAPLPLPSSAKPKASRSRGADDAGPAMEVDLIKDDPRKSILDIVKDKMSASALKWSEVRQWIEDNGGVSGETEDATSDAMLKLVSDNFHLIQAL